MTGGRGPITALVLAALGVAALMFPSPLRASSSGRPRVGVLILAHGGHGSNHWDEMVRKAVRHVDFDRPVQVVFGMGMNSSEARQFQQAVNWLQRKGISRLVVVPLLVSSYSEVYRQYEYLFGLRKDATWPEAGPPLRLEVPVAMGHAMDDHELIAGVLLDRAKSLSREPSRETVVLLGHGPTGEEDNAQWLAQMQRLAGHLKEAGGFARVVPVTFRDDAPKSVRDQAIRELRLLVSEAGQSGPVLVVPVLIAQGGVEDKIPRMLSGLTFQFSGKTLLPHPNVERWLQEEAQRLAEQAPTPGASAAVDDATDRLARSSASSGAMIK